MYKGEKDECRETVGRNRGDRQDLISFDLIIIREGGPFLINMVIAK